MESEVLTQQLQIHAEAYKAPHNIINAILAEDTADGTRRVNNSNTATYREWRASEGVHPYPTTVRRLENFGGYL
ncbi:hypothetical protein DIPPA_20310 [Diplonema papillatum]|nr:hypothetical protein DIPPA_20310 [Diplonema papillatum]